MRCTWIELEMEGFLWGLIDCNIQVRYSSWRVDTGGISTGRTSNLHSFFVFFSGSSHRCGIQVWWSEFSFLSNLRSFPQQIASLGFQQVTTDATLSKICRGLRRGWLSRPARTRARCVKEPAPCAGHSFFCEKRGSPFPWWWSFWVNFPIHSWKVRIVRPWSSKAPSQLRFWGMGTRPKKRRIGFHCNMKEPQYGPQNEEINYIPPDFSKVFSILGWMRFIFVAILASAKYRGTCFSYLSRAERIDFKDGKLGTRSKQQLPKKLIWGSFGCHEIQESRHHEPVSYQHNCITGIMSIQSIMHAG